MNSIALYVEPNEIPEGSVIPAGTITIVPHFGANPEPDFIPFGTIVMGGQSLSRALYPELSPCYTGVGGFYDFTLEDLVQKFIIGFDEDGQVVKGTACIYYVTVRWSDVEDEV